MTLENILRGSGDLGAMLSAGWGLRQIDPDRNMIYVANTKARDFEPCLPFVLQGRPALDEQGRFALLEPPGRAQPLRQYLEETKDNGGRRATPDKDTKVAQAVELRAQGMSLRAISQRVGTGKSNVERWLFEYDLSQKCPSGTEFRDNAESRTAVGGEASP